MGLIAEFKNFIMRGNVVDLAVGVIIGAAFGHIVTSLVADIMMPPIGWAMNGINFNDLAIDLPGTMVDPATKDKPVAEQKLIPVKIGYGKFLQKLIEFVITAFCLFMVIKAVNQAIRKKEESPKAPDVSTTEKLLMEIRDSLKK
jgi:large conductance mechanosensitive channel